MSGFIDLNARGGGGGRQVPPVPPPAPGAPQGGQRPMQHQQPSMQARMHHQQQVGGMPVQQQQQQQQQPRIVAHPPSHQVPQHMLAPPPVEVVDIRMERMSDSQAREQLSEYFVYRFEKIMDQERFDNEGRLLKPNWQQARKVQENDPKVEIQRQISRLNKKHTLSDMKKELNADQLYHIDKALDQLRARQRHPEYEVKLVQLDDRVKPLSDVSRFEERGRRGDKEKEKDKDKRKKSKLGSYKTKSSRDKKPKWQRVAVIAYYKLSPKPDVDALLLLQRRQQDQMNALQEAQNQRHFQQRVQREQQDQHLRELQQQHQQRNFARQQQGHQEQHHPGQHGHANGRRPPPGGRIEVVTEHSDSGSSNSSDSDSDSWSSVSTEVTRPSSGSNSTGRHYRKKNRYIEPFKPRHFGKQKGVHRHHTKYGNSEYTVEPGVSSSLRGLRSPAVPAVPLSRVEEIRENAYAAGIADGKTQERIEAERIEELVDRRVAREMPRPRVIQSPIVAEDRILEALQGVQIVDAEPRTRYRHVPRHYDEYDDLDSIREGLPPRRQSYEIHRGPEVRQRPWESQHREASRYMDSRESPILAPENPFNPLPKREGGQYRHRY